LKKKHLDGTIDFREEGEGGKRKEDEDGQYNAMPIIFEFSVYR
jgi:hypothetical protein